MSSRGKTVGPVISVTYIAGQSVSMSPLACLVLYRGTWPLLAAAIVPKASAFPLLGVVSVYWTALWECLSIY